MCEYQYKDLIFSSAEDMLEYFKKSAITLTDDLAIDQIFTIDSRLLGAIKKEYGTNEVYKEATSLFAESIEKYMYPSQDVVVEKGALKNIALTRAEALTVSAVKLKNRLDKLKIALENGTINPDRLITYQALSVLLKENNWKDMIQTFYPNFLFRKNKIGGFDYEESNAPIDNEVDGDKLSLPNDVEEMEDVSFKLSGLQNFTVDSDTINPLNRTSQAVKDLMSTVYISFGKGIKERLKPGFVFYKLLQNITGIDVSEYTQGEHEIEQIRQNFIANGMPVHPDISNRSYAIFSKIENLINTSNLVVDSDGKDLPLKDYQFVWKGDNLKGWYQFEDGVNKKLYNLKGYSTPQMIEQMALATGLSYDVIHKLYIKTQASDTINSIFTVVNSLRAKNPIFGKYEWKFKATVEEGKKVFKQTLERKYTPFKEIAFQSIAKNDIAQRLIAHKEFILESNTNDYNSHPKLQSFLYKIGVTDTADFHMSQSVFENVTITLNKLKEQLKEIGKETDKLDDEGHAIIFDENAFFSDNEGYLTTLAGIVFSNKDDLGRSSSYRADNKSKWFHVLTNQALDTILKIINKNQNLPKFLSQSGFEYNIFIGTNKQNVIHDFFEHEHIEDETENSITEPVAYKQENIKNWYDRNFLYAFANVVGNMTKKGIPTYIQQFYTISNKPQISGARINVLGETEIKKSIEQALLQEINRNIDNNVTNMTKNKTISFMDVEYSMENASKNISEIVEQVWKKMEENSQKAYEAFIATSPTLDTSFIKAYYALVHAGIITDSVSITKEEHSIFYKNGAPKTDEQKTEVAKFLYPAFDVFYKNYFINSIFLNQIVMGQQFQFKDAYDQIKRMSIGFAQGYSGRVNNETGLKKTFNLRVYEDINKVISNDLERIYKFIKLRNKDFDITDGQGFCIVERADNIRKGFSREGNIGATMKPVYYGIGETDGIARGLKYSSIEITNELARAFPALANLRYSLTFDRYIQAHPNEENEIKILYNKNINEKLSEKEYFDYKSIINKAYAEDLVDDEMIFKSGMKVGAPISLSTIDENGVLTTNNDSVVKLYNKNYKHQLNPRHDADTHTTNPTQLTGLINTNGKNYEAQAKVLKLNNILALNGFAQKLTDFKITDADNVKNNGSWNNIRAIIRNEMQKLLSKVAGNEQIVEFLDSGISLQIPFLTNKLQQTLIASFSKASVEIKHSGSKLILQSAVGTNSEILEKGKLREPRVVYLDKNGMAIVDGDLETEAHSYYMECYLPEAMYKNLIKQGYTADQILNDDVYNRVLGFRIPSTELHSAVPLKIIGWYPNNNGDNVIIAPSELVLLHGSDFDIDSLYIIKPSIADKEIKDKHGNILTHPKTAYGYEIKNGKTIPLQFLKGQSFSEYLQKEIENNSKDVEYVKQMRELLSNAGSNEIMSTFLDVIQDAKNQEDMFTPIDMGIFNNLSDPSSVFSYFTKLSGKPLLQKRNLNKLDDELLMHQDNFRSTLLTGSFANANKTIAYIFAAANNFIETSLSEEEQILPELKENLHFSLDEDTYKGFNRYILEDGTLQDGKNGTERNTIFQTIDALINAAIDHVKVQILNVINASEETGNALMSMVAMGVPIKKVSLFMVQPVLKELVNKNEKSDIIKASLKSNYIGSLYKDEQFLADLNAIKGKKVEGSDASEALTIEAEQGLKLKYWNKFQEIVKDYTLSTKDMENMYEREYSSLSTEKEFIIQYKVLQSFEKFNDIGNYLFKGALFLNSLKQLPADFVGLQNILDNGNEFFNIQAYLKGEEFKNPDGFPFTNVNLSVIPNVQSSTIIVDRMLRIVGEVIIKNKKEMVDFSEKVNNELKNSNIDEETDSSPSKKGFLDYNYNKATQAVRDNFIKYLLSGVVIPLENQFLKEFSTNFSNESPLTISIYNKKKDEHYTKTLYGADAWMYKMIEQGYSTEINGEKVTMMSLKEIIAANKNNEFIGRLLVNKGADNLSFNISMPVGANVDPIEKLDYERGFEKLREVSIYRNEEGEIIPAEIIGTNQYNELQYNLLKYCIIADGLAFGSYKFGALMGTNIYKGITKWLDDILFGLIGYEKNNKFNINNIKDQFSLQLALQNAGKNYNLDNKKSKKSSLALNEKGEIITGKETILTEEGREKEVFFDLKLNLNEEIDMPIIGRKGNSVYVKVAQTSKEAYYQLAGRQSSITNFSFNKEDLNYIYNKKEFFDASKLFITVKELNAFSLILNTRYETKSSLLSPGVRFFATTPNDGVRINATEYEVVKIESTIENFKKITVKEIGKIERTQEIKDLSWKAKQIISNTQVKPGAEELFKSNPELAEIGTPQQYASYLNTIFPDSKVKEMDNSLYISVLNQLEQENIIDKDCNGLGKLKAEKGLQTNFTKGGKWEIYEIFEGKSHKQGGIDINIKNNQISFTNKNGSIKAKYGLVISKENKL